MARLVIVKNPFQPWEGREIREIPKGFTIRQVIEMTEFKGIEVNCVINDGTQVSENYVLPDDALLTISPVVGKGGIFRSILTLVAVVALAVVSAGAGAAVADAATAAGASAGLAMAAGFLTQMAIMFVGAKLIQRISGQQADSGRYSGYENNATYSWSGVTTMEGQNNPIALTYGKVKTGGQTIGKFINVSDDDEYLNWLVAAGEGPLEISDIKLNDNEIEYYNDVTYEVREGTNDQEIIQNFNDTYFTQSFNELQLLADPVVRTCQGNATEGIKFKITFPGGLYYAKDNGKLGPAWVKIAAYYSVHGQNAWTQFVEETITASQTSAVRKEYRLDDLPAGSYDVMLEVTGRQYEVTNSRAGGRVFWTELTSIVYDDFSYPNIALIGIKAKATDQISGAPSLSFIKERKNVLVWNPHTEQYEEKPANNPAWASYDVLHLCSRLKNINTGEYEYEVRGIPAKHMIYDQFKEWADFCTAKEFEVNIELVSAGEMLSLVNDKVAVCGRGMIVRYGTRYGCVWDCAKQPVQMFGMGNIVAGSFREEFSQVSDRANCVEITYTDKKNDYNRETITIYSDTYDTDGEERIAQATFDGITSYNQAYREGMYQLYANKYQLRTITFDAAIDAIACTINDVILVAHDVPMWAKSGRIHSVDLEKRELLLPVELENTTGQFRILYRTVKDRLVTKSVEILHNADGWCKVRCLSPFEDGEIPQANDIFDLALTQIGSKPFIVKGITRAQNFTRTLTCVEYNENLYNENYDIPTIQYSSYPTGAENVKNITAVRSKGYNDVGEIIYTLDVSWERATVYDEEKQVYYTSAGTFNVFYTVDGVNYTLAKNGIKTNSFSDSTVDLDIVGVKVVTVNGLTNSSGVTAEVSDVDYSNASIAIEDLTIEAEPATDGYLVYLTWSDIQNPAIKWYEITSNGETYRQSNSSLTVYGIPPGTYSCSIQAVLVSGVKGPAITGEITLEELPPEFRGEETNNG